MQPPGEPPFLLGTGIPSRSTQELGRARPITVLRKIEMEEPLKELGTHAVTIRLAPGAEAKVTVIIEREE